MTQNGGAAVARQWQGFADHPSPHLTRDDIRAAVAYAADTIAYEEIDETATRAN